MEDWYPFHMQKRNYFGDVAIPERKPSGVTFNRTSTATPKDFKNSVFMLNTGGTGFLISISETTINRNLKKVGLLLTAAHVILNIDTGHPSSGSFNCYLNRDSDEAYLIKEFATISTHQHYCQSTGFDYCLPGDVALLLVTLDNSKSPEFFEPIGLSNMELNDNCYVSGFPQRPFVNPRYCIPDPNISDSQIYREIDAIFNNFLGIVYSHGKVLNKNETLLEISCSTTSGMSGSPIISQGKYLGVYVGGPALPGQRELMLIVNRINEESYGEALRLIERLAAFDHLYDNKILEIFRAQTRHHIVYLLGKSQLGRELTHNEIDRINCFNNDALLCPGFKDIQIETFLDQTFKVLYSVVWNYKERGSYQANIGISYENIVFRDVDRIVREFSDVSMLEFVEVNDLVNYLKNL